MEVKFRIDRASNAEPPIDDAVREDDGCWYIELSTLESMIELLNRVGRDLIIARTIGDDGYWLTIYDDYLE